VSGDNLSGNGKTASIQPWAFVVTMESQERIDPNDLLDVFDDWVADHPEILSIQVEALGTIKVGH
jgi:hypothetical protein